MLLCPPSLAQADTNPWDQAPWDPLGAVGVLLHVPPSATVLLFVFLPSGPLASGFCLDFDILPPALLQHTFPASKGFHTTTQLADPSPCCSEALELWRLELHWDSKPTSRLHTLSPLSPGWIQELMYSLSSSCPHCQPWGKLSSTRPYTSQQPLSAQARRAPGNELPPRYLAQRRQPNPMVPGPCCVPEPGPPESVASLWALQLHLPLPPAPRTPLSAVLAAAPVTCPFCAARRFLQRLCL